MENFTYTNIFDGTKDPIIVEAVADTHYKLIGHGVDFVLPLYFSDIIEKIQENYKIEFNGANPLYADFSVSVERNITNYETETLLKGVETSLSDNVQVSDYRFLLSLKNVTLTFFNDTCDEFSSNDITDLVLDFNEKNEHCDIGDERLRRFYDIVEDLVRDEDID
jgi:hypothetical protein